MKVCSIGLITCLAWWNYKIIWQDALLHARTMLLAKRSRSQFTYAMSLGYDENMFVTYSYPVFTAKNISLFGLHGPSIVSFIVYKSVFIHL